jgi:hypothetical protein
VDGSLKLFVADFEVRLFVCCLPLEARIKSVKRLKMWLFDMYIHRQGRCMGCASRLQLQKN